MKIFHTFPKKNITDSECKIKCQLKSDKTNSIHKGTFGI